MASLDLIGIGNAIVDVLTQTDESFVENHRINKGAMTLIEEAHADELYSHMGPAVEMSGGSAANTIAAFAAMGGNAGFIGKVADDQLGKVFCHDIQAAGATYQTKPLTDSLPTARCLILVTPDAERTMCTYLGASVWITPGDIDKQFIQTAKVVYLEGYLFDKPQAKKAFMKAADLAHEAGRKVALSLSDPFCVERHRAEFLNLIENHIDILFANQYELMALVQEDDLDHALDAIQDKCEIAAITKGKEGSVILEDQSRYNIDVMPVPKVMDTTGAGDLYAAGFLYAYTRGENPDICGQYASIAASTVIQHMGARSQQDWPKLFNFEKTVNE